MPYKFILFDLDDTLYSSETGLLREVGHRIQMWLCERMKLSWEDAQVLRRDYFIRYGTTLNGLIAEHNIDAHDYLVYVHDIPVERHLQADPLLAEMLGDLPLRRVVFTNATTEYCQRVLGALGVADCFERIISIEDVGLCNKMYRGAYERALGLLEARGAECIMVEDSVRNLQAAKALGMATVLVGMDGKAGRDAPVDERVDFALESVIDVRSVVTKLLRSEAGETKIEEE